MDENDGDDKTLALTKMLAISQTGKAKLERPNWKSVTEARYKVSNTFILTTHELEMYRSSR